MRTNRRRFIRGVGAGVFGGAFLIRCAGPVDDPGSTSEPERHSDMVFLPLGFQSYSLRRFPELEAFATEAEKLGLPYVELYRGHLPVEAPPERIVQVRERLSAAGVMVNAFGVERFGADHALNERVFRFGRELGVVNLSAAPTRDAFDSLEELVDRYDIRIAIHNHGPEDELWARPEWILEAVRDRDDRIGACVDTGHYLRSGVSPVEAIRMLGSRVLGVHFKDFDAELREVIPGDGQLDVEATLEALRDVGFDGPFSLEFEEFPDDPVPHMRVAVERVTAVLENWAAAG
jgi:inosose dehydratase